MRQLELSTMSGYSKQSFLVTREERKRFGLIAAKWRKENPKASILQEMLFENLLTLHIQRQRLLDRRVMFDGTPTTYCSLGGHVTNIDSEDLKQKEREFEKYMPQIQKQWTDLMKIALANSINIDVSGDVSELFKALDKQKTLEKD